MDSLNPQTRVFPLEPLPHSTQDDSRRVPAKARKRGRKACLSCRARKVRCDVSQRGRPCANCYLDSEPCVVTGRASKYRRAQYDVQDGIQTSLPPYEPLSRASNNPRVAGMAANLGSASPINSPPHEGSAALLDQPAVEEPADFHHRDADRSNTQDAFAECQENLAGPSSRPFSSPQAPHNTSTLEDMLVFHKPNHLSMGFQSHPPTAGSASVSSELSYCCYPFLTLTNIHQISQQDAGFLDSQGCLRVPIRPFLDELVQHYFLHVHPFLPLINEGDFWELYCCGSRYPPENTMSLLLLQAMLFAACTFISESTRQALGYQDVRTMRATFLRRTKLLYDMECESSPLVVAQACILLSFTSLSSSRKPNTLWLSLAIENAKLAEAHLYPAISSPLRSKEQNILKRLWWCCIIRDRSMSLLMRLPIRITKGQFDFNTNLLTSKDMEDELQRSKVYNSTTKLRLSQILAQSVKLYTTLTDTLLLIHPPKGMQISTQQEQDESHVKLQECKAALRQWHASAISELPKIHDDPNLMTSPNTSRSTSHESTILYTNLMYMYYHTANIVLCHHEVLQRDILRESTEPCYSLAQDLSTIFKTRSELQDATSDIIECHKELLRLGLTQWLPSSAIGFILLPLMLNILDVKLSPPPRTELDQTQTSGTRPQQLNILIQFMRVYWPRYDGVEWVSEIIRHIIELAQLDEAKVRRKTSSVNWADIFAFQPRSYLRLVLTLDLSLSKGRLPDDWDFPIKLRGLFSFDANPLKEFAEGNYTNLESPRVASPPLQAENSNSPETTGSDQVQHHILGLDECLIATLESQFVFGECIGLPDAADFQLQSETGTSSAHLEGLSSVGCSSASSNTNKEINESHEYTALDC